MLLRSAGGCSTKEAVSAPDGIMGYSNNGIQCYLSYLCCPKTWPKWTHRPTDTETPIQHADKGYINYNYIGFLSEYRYKERSLYTWPPSLSHV